MPRPLSGVEELPTSRRRPQLRQGRSGKPCAARPPLLVSRFVCPFPNYHRGLWRLMGERVQDARSQVVRDRPQSVCLEPATKWTPPRPERSCPTTETVRNKTIESPKPIASRISRGCLLTLYLECCSAPHRGLRRIENAAVGQLYCCWLKGRIGASLGRPVRVPNTRGLAS